MFLLYGTDDQVTTICYKSASNLANFNRRFEIGHTPDYRKLANMNCGELSDGWHDNITDSAIRLR